MAGTPQTSLRGSIFPLRFVVYSAIALFYPSLNTFPTICHMLINFCKTGF